MRHVARRANGVRAGLTLAALGVVFGDIGTSPIYALQTVFSIDNGAVRPTSADVYGVISTVFWSVTLIVSIKYVTIVMRADNDGEGGVMALAGLARRAFGHGTRAAGVDRRRCAAPDVAVRLLRPARHPARIGTGE
jgi:KUP system potassium uptake protein